MSVVKVFTHKLRNVIMMSKDMTILLNYP